MSSADGLERLKNWKSAETALLLVSASLKGRIDIFDVRVRVLFVDESILVLLNLDAPGDAKTFDLRGATFSCSDSRIADLELILATGTKPLLREEG